MERVNLLIERTGERVACLLNPEDMEARRTAGVRRRAGAGGVLMGGGRTDDPLIATGGGVTEYDLRLLFDVDVAREGRPSRGGAAPGPADVREMTRPLWDLAENAEGDALKGPPRVRIIWGKAWNVPGVVLAVAERLERFDPDGAPQRSWLSLRLRRVEDEQPPPPEPGRASDAEPMETVEPLAPPAIEPGLLYDRIDVPTDLDGTPLERLDLIAATHYGDPALAPALAAYNGLDQMLRLPPGASLVLPPGAVLRGTA